MSDILVTSPYRPFTLPNQFKAVFNGYVYCGTIGAVDPSNSQVQVYKVNEDGSRVPVAQPLRTNAGGFLVYNGQPAKFVTNSSHSLLVRDSLNLQVWYEPDMSSADPETLSEILSSSSGASTIGTSGGGNVQSDLDEIKEDVSAITNSNVIVVNPIIGVIDDTDRINDILQAGKTAYFTRGVYNIDLDVGLLAATGCAIDGAGSMNVVILANQKGGSVAQLASYTKGSMFKRVFNPGLANDYVSGVKINNVSFIMRHPTSIDIDNYRQIAIDMRNIDRSWIGPDTYVGNTTLPGMPFTWEPPRATQAQGYGIVYGTRNSNSIDYCGGVGGIAESPKVYGARKPIVVDDLQLSPQSAAHATIVRSPDIQIGVELISQASPYNAGTVFEDCLLQSSQRFEASDVTIGMLIAGYNCRGTIRYLEGGPNCDEIAELTSSSSDSEIDVLYASVTGASVAAIIDNGVNNRVSYRELTAVSGGKTTKGRLVETFNKGYASRRVVSTFVNLIGPQPVTGDSGVSVSRTGAGAYIISLDKPFSGEFGVNVTAKTNPSRQGFSFAYSAKTNNSIKIDTWVGNTSLDPEQMTIEIFQV